MRASHGLLNSDNDTHLQSICVLHRIRVYMYRMSACNATPFLYNTWTARDDVFRLHHQITPGGFTEEDNTSSEDFFEEDFKPLREKNSRKNAKGTHVPHRDKPPQVVAKRNARERRRVQAVNGAFMKLRKAVPFENHRGKRISKVKTLQNAIEYIQNLEELLRKEGDYEAINVFMSAKPKMQDQYTLYQRNFYTPSDDLLCELDYDLPFRRNNNFLN